jgi:type II secretory pathway pseudopilin PulG
MRRPRGKTLAVLGLVVAVLSGMFALALPTLQRARVAANEATVFNEIRSLGAAQDEYARLNGGRFGTLECLARPATCLASSPKERPGLLTAEVASLATRAGYARRFELSEGGEDYQYWAIPERPGRSGVRAFCADADFYAARTLDDVGKRCDSLRGSVFEGVQADAERRRRDRERLRRAAAPPADAPRQAPAAPRNTPKPKA